ncbi:TolC family protein [Methylomonas sp. 2BW1-5-20]|uniref:TolC family protein n=1 Tax=Methylomonas sp. 2BW1-5-20 TaxID=3376686 RepID=UPI00404C6611
MKLRSLLLLGGLAIAYSHRLFADQDAAGTESAAANLQPAYCESVSQGPVRSLNLHSALKLALCKNPAIVKARSDIQAARLAYDAEDAKYASELEFTVNENYQTGDTSKIQNLFATSTDPVEIRGTSERLYMSLRWTAPWWYKSEFKYEAAKSQLGIHLAQVRYARTEQDTIFSVYKAFLAAVVQDRKLRIENQKLQAINEQSLVQQKNFNLGRSSELGVVIEEGNLLNQQLTTGDTQELLETKKSELLALLGIKDDPAIVVEDHPLQARTVDLQAFGIDKALQYQSQETHIQIAQQAIEIDKHDDVWKPNISTWAGYSPYIKSVGTSQGREINDWVSVGVEVQVELPNFSASDAAVKVANHDKMVLSEQLQNIAEDTRSQSRQLQQKLNKLIGQMDLLDKLQKVQERRVEAGRKSVELGSMNQLEFQVLQSNLDATAMQRYDKLFDYLVAEAELKHLYGMEIVENIR